MSEELDKKKKRLKELLSKIDEVGVEEIKDDFKDLLEDLSPLEIPEIEQELVGEGRSPEEISKICDVHVELFKESLESRVDPSEFKSGHPLRSFIKENNEISNDAEKLNLYIKSFESKKEEEVSSKLDDFLVLVNKLLGIDKTHYERLEMLVFPHIERRGISAVPRLLWKKHQENMSKLKKLKKKLMDFDEKRSFESLFSEIKDLSNQVSSDIINMVFREEKILYPTLNKLLSSNEWGAIQSQEKEIGYYGNYSPEDEWSFNEELVFPNQLEKGVSQGEFEELPEDLKDVLGGEVPDEIDFGKKKDEDLVLDTGNISIKELNQLFKTLPVDLTFIGKDDRVRFFSDKNRIFNRTRSIIGRPVMYCHPPSSVDVVKEIISKFKSGEEDEADFWLQMGDDFIYISYHAIRDGDKYLGAVEMTQEISDIREFKGNKTLLDW